MRCAGGDEMKKNNRLGMPTIKNIVAAQNALILRLGIEQPDDDCWGCRSDDGDGPLTRCHIVAVRNGGSMAPENFFLLCELCHRNQPDGMSLSTQLIWLETIEYCLDRRARKLRPISDAFRKFGEENKVLLEEFMNANGSRVQEIGDDGAKRSASNRTSNILANAIWSTFDALLQFAAQRSDAQRSDAMQGDAMQGDALQGDAQRSDAIR
jgi:hypothetical protein